MASYNVTALDIERVLARHKPEHPIALDKLASKADVTVDRMYAIKRRMQEMGFATEQRRRKDFALITLHNPALPEFKRQMPITRNRNGACASVKDGTDAWKAATVTTYTVKSGQYSAAQLRSLAVNVLRELGYTVTRPGGKS